jgi:hypothetical protein
MTPVVAVPAPVAAAMPAPVVAVPAPVTPMPVPVPVVAPANLLGLEALDFVSGRDGGMKVFAGGQLSTRCERMWRQRRGLCACGQRGRASGYTESELQKVATFHDISPALVAVGC